MNDIQTSVTQRLLYVRLQLVLTFLDQLDGLVIVRPFKRQIPVQHAVEYNAARPDVDPAVDFVVLRVEKALGCHVA